MGPDPQVADDPRPRGAAGESREASGLTTRLVLEFVERDGGRAAVERVLELSGMTEREEQLRDENEWFSDRARVRLFEAAAIALDDPNVARRIGTAAIEFSVGQALKLSLRALGSPRLIYSNIARANAKFNRVHEMEVLAIGPSSARIRNVPIGGAQHHPIDCEYNIGLLSVVPLIFGEGHARVRHSRCIAKGDPDCIYEVEWSTLDRSVMLVALVACALVGLLLCATLLPGLLPFAAVAAGLIAAYAGSRAIADRRRRWRLLEDQITEQADAADLLMASMQDVVSALRLDEVLSKVTANAQAAVGGAEFALLVAEAGGLRARSSSDLPPRTVATLEAWATKSPFLLREPVTIDDLGAVPELAGLALDRSLPLGSLCSSPLVYRGQELGVLIALSSAASPFLPRDGDLLSSYAAQVAIALTNAQLYAAQQELAIQDPLTGLFNHRHFHETLERELERCRRHGGELGLALFDLDGFKRVNDTGGHAEGDGVLREVAAELRSSCRGTDLPFRVGGDEFAIVLPAGGPEATAAAATRARERIARIDPRTSVSFGISSWPDAGPTKDALLARADASLYEMKRASDPGAAAAGDEERAGRDEPKRLACASRMAIRLAAAPEEDEIARKAVAELRETFGYERVAIHRILPDSVLLPIAVDGVSVECFLDAGAVAPAGRTASRAARTGEAVLVADATALTVGNGNGGVPPAIRNGAGRGSELATPIRVDGGPWGVLELVHRERHGFDFDDLLFADTIAATIGAAVHRSLLYAEREGTFMRTLAVLCDALEAKDSYTAVHAREVAELAERVAAAIGMSPAELRTLSYAALLHDIGKIAIPSKILQKPGPLTEAEYEEMKQHTVVGARMLERIPYFAEVHPLVRCSHERWDGNGYPDRLAGTEIPLGARIISACDAFNAMTSDRPYRSAMDPDAAVEELRRNSGSQFDADVIDALIDVLGERGAAIEPHEVAL